MIMYSTTVFDTEITKYEVEHTHDGMVHFRSKDTWTRLTRPIMGEFQQFHVSESDAKAWLLEKLKDEVHKTKVLYLVKKSELDLFLIASKGSSDNDIV